MKMSKLQRSKKRQRTLVKFSSWSMVTSRDTKRSKTSQLQWKPCLTWRRQWTLFSEINDPTQQIPNQPSHKPGTPAKIDLLKTSWNRKEWYEEIRHWHIDDEIVYWRSWPSWSSEDNYDDEGVSKEREKKKNAICGGHDHPTTGRTRGDKGLALGLVYWGIPQVVEVWIYTDAVVVHCWNLTVK